uniref:Uncharacterized protein n=1 Tax=Rhizophora mucronata TaxID=61149 RepID=A0A2P2N1L0_RHIMU
MLTYRCIRLSKVRRNHFCRIMIFYSLVTTSAILVLNH